VLEALAVLLAGVGAGMINTIVGSGTLITFPTLLALGVPPVTANMSNTLGLVPGSAAGVYGYRRELAGQRARILRLLGASVAGGIAGAVLLLVLPPGAFEAVVPVLILLGVVLVIVQPRLAAWVQRSRAHAAVAAEPGRRAGHGPPPDHDGAWWVRPGVVLTGVYGGYFGAAQGVLLMGILGIGVAESLQRLNAVKNVLAGAVNAVAGLVFVLAAASGRLGPDARIDWLLVMLLAAGAVVGGLLGATIGRRLPPLVLRWVIVVVGLTAVTVILAG
jgi:uncharacterized membrane protein YfcA